MISVSSDLQRIVLETFSGFDEFGTTPLFHQVYALGCSSTPLARCERGRDDQLMLILATAQLTFL